MDKSDDSSTQYYSAPSVTKRRFFKACCMKNRAPRELKAGSFEKQLRDKQQPRTNDLRARTALANLKTRTNNDLQQQQQVSLDNTQSASFMFEEHSAIVPQAPNARSAIKHSQSFVHPREHSRPATSGRSPMSQYEKGQILVKMNEDYMRRKGMSLLHLAVPRTYKARAVASYALAEKKKKAKNKKTEILSHTTTVELEELANQEMQKKGQSVLEKQFLRMEASMQRKRLLRAQTSPWNQLTEGAVAGRAYQHTPSRGTRKESQRTSSNALLSSMAASVGVKEIYTVASKDHHSEYGADKKEGQSNLAQNVRNSALGNRAEIPTQWPPMLQGNLKYEVVPRLHHNPLKFILSKYQIIPRSNYGKSSLKFKQLLDDYDVEPFDQDSSEEETLPVVSKPLRRNVRKLQAAVRAFDFKQASNLLQDSNLGVTNLSIIEGSCSNLKQELNHLKEKRIAIKKRFQFMAQNLSNVEKGDLNGFGEDYNVSDFLQKIRRNLLLYGDEQKL